MPTFVMLKSHPQPLPRHITRLIPQEGFSFIDTGDGNDSFFSHERFIDPGFERLDVDAPVPFIDAPAIMGLQAGLQAKHATAARHSHHSHARR